MGSVDSRKLPREEGGQKQEWVASIPGSFLGRRGQDDQNSPRAHPAPVLSRVSAPPPRLKVNRGTCRFGRYKNPRRPHPPPRASRVSHHPPQVSGLTLAHPCSPTLTRPRPPPSARPIDSGCAGPFLAPGQRGRNGLPRRCRFWLQRIGW